jgi:UrcA family protein
MHMTNEINLVTASRFLTVIATSLFGAVASSFAVLPAIADSLDVPKVTVKYGDLNLSNPQGAAALYARIRSAAKSVCSQFDGPGIDPYRLREICINQAISGAVAKVNSPELSAVYSAKARKKVPTRLVSR